MKEKKDLSVTANKPRVYYSNKHSQSLPLLSVQAELRAASLCRESQTVSTHAVQIMSGESGPDSVQRRSRM